ncbi:response regulator transcription factor [Enterococcus songbeiensis]
MEQPKLIIVDDEELSADGLELLIGYTNLDVDIVGVYYSSMHALEFLENNPVDIVITDLNMPELSGLDLIEQIKAINPMIQLMILTGFGTLDYAKQAMRFGVKYFLQKPTSPKELKENLEQCLLDLKRNQMNQFLHWKESIEAIILGKGNADHSLIPPFKLVMYADDHYSLFHPIVEKTFVDLKIRYVFGGLKGAVAYYIFSDQSFQSELSRKITEVTTHPSIIFVSDKGSQFNIDEVFQRGIKSFETSFYSMGPQLFIDGEAIEDNSDIPDRFVTLYHHILTNDFSNGLRYLEKILKYAKEILFSVEDLKREAIDFCKKILGEVLRDKNTDYQNFPIKILESDSISQIEVLLKKCIQLVEEMKDVEMMQGSISANLNWLIEKHYNYSDLSLRWISKNKLFLNPEYLGKAYLKETGQKFSQKLFEIRMQKAVELIKDGYKVYEVAEMVGYEKNPDYFIQLFKKKYGITPKQFVQQNGGKTS